MSFFSFLISFLISLGGLQGVFSERDWYYLVLLGNANIHELIQMSGCISTLRKMP
jgi:hypothetical protein